MCGAISQHTTKSCRNELHIVAAISNTAITAFSISAHIYYIIIRFLSHQFGKYLKKLPGLRVAI
jgi:hypothetical protein